jgi:hypothetical protein
MNTDAHNTDMDAQDPDTHDTNAYMDTDMDTDTDIDMDMDTYTCDH